MPLLQVFWTSAAIFMFQFYTFKWPLFILQRWSSWVGGCNKQTLYLKHVKLENKVPQICRFFRLFATFSLASFSLIIIIMTWEHVENYQWLQPLCMIVHDQMTSWSRGCMAVKAKVKLFWHTIFKNLNWRINEPRYNWYLLISIIVLDFIL